MQHKTGKWLLMMTLACSSAWACSDDDDVPVGTAGSGGTAVGGKGGTAAGGDGGKFQGGDGGTAGGGEAGSCQDDGENCPYVDACGPLPLSELCASPGACPTLEEIGPFRHCAANDMVVTSRELSCGGQVIVNEYELSSETWGFDASGKLTYKRESGDVASICPDGRGVSAATVWGSLPCAAVGPELSLCDAGGAGGGGAGGAGGGGGAGGATAGAGGASAGAGGAN